MLKERLPPVSEDKTLDFTGTTTKDVSHTRALNQKDDYSAS